VTTEDLQREPFEAVFERATHAAYEALPGASPASVEDTARALRAASDVFADADQKYADELVAATSIAGFNLNGDGRLDLVLAHELAAKIALSFKTILGAQPGAENYVEQEIIERNGGDRYVFIVCKPGGKTPHALRREAEASRDALAAQVVRLMNALDQIELLTKDTDGGDIDGDADIPVGEIRRVFAEVAGR
jgi:hypothetical protein